MATGTGTRLSELERTWFQQKLTGANARTPLGELKKLYYLSVVGSGYSGTSTLRELEIAWIKVRIVDAGGTPTATKYESTLWRELIAALGQTPSRFTEENKKLFFSSVV